jgi:hypothetical protein
MTQAARQRYRKRTDALVTAVQLRLDTPGLVYQKWGAEQRCKAGDWLIDNDGDIYTVSDESFRATYREVAAGRYRKTASVWAVAAEVAGTLSTQEGQTSYAAGTNVRARLKAPLGQP